MINAETGILLCLNVVCCAVRRQVLLPDGGPISALGGNCDIICDEETYTGIALCASDGTLYKSQCEFNNAQCKAIQNGDKFSVVSYGACVTVDTTCDVVSQARCSTIGTSVFGGSVQWSEPICGSNNRTYHSLCEFRKTQCKQQMQGSTTTLTLAHTGRCLVDTSNALMINCSNYIVHNSGLAIEGGGSVYPHAIGCPKINKPVCSMDGRTFANDCTYCNYLITLHELPADNLVTYAAHEGRCTGVDIIG